MNQRSCPKCGHIIEITTGGNIHCPKCGYAENDLVYRGYSPLTPVPDPTPYTPPFTTPNTPLIDDNPNFGFGNTGWICPKCGRGVSPLVSVCPCYHDSCGMPDVTCTLQSQIDFNKTNMELIDKIINDFRTP